MPGDFTPVDPWPVRFPCDVSTSSPYVTGIAVKFASDVLWALTGRQFGYTTVKLRPTRWHKHDTPFPDVWLAWPGTFGSYWGAVSFGAWWGWPDLDPVCGSPSEAHLPAPVTSVTEVKVDGVVLTGGGVQYRMDDNRILVRTDGSTWPLYNDLARDDTQVNTWSVTAKFGQSVPSGAEIAVGELACEYLRALGGEDCSLPKNVTQVARQGVTISMPDPSEMFDKGLTGLRMVDTFITTWNPGHLRARARSYSVDTAMARRTNT
jgi:hypothetical protein